MIGPVRHNPSTVVVLAGQTTEQVLAAVGRSLNVVLVRPEPTAVRRGRRGAGIEAAAGALRRAAGITAPYVLVAADPLAAVAAAWQAMWEVTAEPRGSDEFELRAAEALAAWRAKRFELPDYYLVLAEETARPQRRAGARRTERRRRLLPGAAARRPAEPGVRRRRGLARRAGGRAAERARLAAARPVVAVARRGLPYGARLLPRRARRVPTAGQASLLSCQAPAGCAARSARAVRHDGCGPPVAAAWLGAGWRGAGGDTRPVLAG